MRRVLRLAQARAGLSNEVRDTRCRKSRCVRIHRAIPQPEDAAKTRQAGSEVLNPFTTVRDFGVEPEDPDYRAELDRSLMAYGAYLSRTELAEASTLRSLGEYDLPHGWYLLKDDIRSLDSTGESGASALAFVNENHKKIVIAYRGS